MNAAATWRLRLACHFDPGDMVLYEILYAQTPGDQADQALAEQAIRRALLPAAGFSDALTGAGAAVNLLNEALQPEKAASLDHALAARWWTALDQCLLRYQSLRATAVAEQWWEGIPETRREELDSHAAFLERLSASIRQQLVAKQILR